MGAPFRVVYQSNLQQVGARTRRKLRAVVAKAAHDVEAHAKAAMTEPKTGRIYRAETAVSFKTKGGAAVGFTAYAGSAGHQASAPGEAPAIDTSNLANSITTEVDPSRPAAQVVVGAEYGAPLEFGTDDGKIAPRPFLGPAVAAVEPSFLTAAEAVVKQAIEESSL